MVTLTEQVQYMSDHVPVEVQKHNLLPYWSHYVKAWVDLNRFVLKNQLRTGFFPLDMTLVKFFYFILERFTNFLELIYMIGSITERSRVSLFRRYLIYQIFQLPQIKGWRGKFQKALLQQVYRVKQWEINELQALDMGLAPTPVFPVDLWQRLRKVQPDLAPFNEHAGYQFEWKAKDHEGYHVFRNLTASGMWIPVMEFIMKAIPVAGMVGTGIYAYFQHLRREEEAERQTRHPLIQKADTEIQGYFAILRKRIKVPPSVKLNQVFLARLGFCPLLAIQRLILKKEPPYYYQSIGVPAVLNPRRLSSDMVAMQVWIQEKEAEAKRITHRDYLNYSLI